MSRVEAIWNSAWDYTRVLLAVAGMFGFSMFWFWVPGRIGGGFGDQLGGWGHVVVVVFWLSGWSLGLLLIGSLTVPLAGRRAFTVTIFWVITLFTALGALGESRPCIEIALFQIALIAGAGMARWFLEARGYLDKQVVFPARNRAFVLRRE